MLKKVSAHLCMKLHTHVASDPDCGYRLISCATHVFVLVYPLEDPGQTVQHLFICVTCGMSFLT